MTPPRDLANRVRLAALLTIAYIAITVVMVNPLINFSALGSASFGGDTRLNIWALAWVNHALLTGQDLFNANMFFPASRTFAYTEHLFAISLLTLPIYSATHNPVLGYNLVWLLSFGCNLVAMHMLLRRYTGRDLAAFVGSVFYAFTFYRMLHAHGHLQLIWTCGMPLSVLTLHRWNERPTMRRALVWAAVVTFQCLVSWYLAVLTLIVNALLGAVLLIRSRSELPKRIAQIALAAAVVAVCVWPFAREYRGLENASVAEAAGGSADLAAYIVPPENTLVGRWWLARIGTGPRWIWGEQTIFLGWIAIALAALGAVASIKSRQRLVAFYLVLAGLAYNLSLGPGTKPGEVLRLYDLLSDVQVIGAFRAPARFAEILVLSMSVLIALGVAAVQTRSKRLAGWGVLLLVPLMLAEYYVVGFPGGEPQPFPIPRIYSTPAVRTARAIVSLPMYRRSPNWYLEADYLLFSTAHWRPIVNGYGRAEPPQHFSTVGHMNAFPGPNNARTMRRLGIDYVVLHAAALDEQQRWRISEAMRLVEEYELVGRVDSDFLFRVKTEEERRDSGAARRPDSIR